MTARDALGAAYWRNAYEELVRQTGRDLNDGYGVDPIKARDRQAGQAAIGGAEISAAEELAAIRRRLADSAALEWFVYEVFYANPIAFARQNLVVALQRHLLGLPLATPEEAQRQMLDGMSDDERAEWWRGENARRLAIRGVS